MESLLFFPKSIVIWTHYLPKDVLFQFQMVSELKDKCPVKKFGTGTCLQSKKKKKSLEKSSHQPNREKELKIHQDHWWMVTTDPPT